MARHSELLVGRYSATARRCRSMRAPDGRLVVTTARAGSDSVPVARGRSGNGRRRDRARGLGRWRQWRLQNVALQPVHLRGALAKSELRRSKCTGRDIQHGWGAIAGIEQLIHQYRGAAADINDRRCRRRGNAADQGQRLRSAWLIPADGGDGLARVDLFPVGAACISPAAVSLAGVLWGRGWCSCRRPDTRFPCLARTRCPARRRVSWR